MKADTVRYFKVDRRELVYLKFILEAYEGMSTLSTVEKTATIVRLTIPDGFADDMQKLINAVSADICLTEVTKPDSGTEAAVEVTTPNHSKMVISS